MEGRTHIVGGVAAGLALASYSALDPFVIVGAAVVGSLLPDIDHAKSKISTSNPIMSLVSAVVNIFFTHRTFTHSAVFLVLVGYLFYRLDWLPGLLPGMVVGIASHLILDAMTKQGIKFLWPLNATIRIPLFIRTGSGVERVVEVLLLAAAVYFGAIEFGIYKGS